MLGKPVGKASDVIKSLKKNVDLSKLVAEFKYDGERTQIHWANG
jgi:ATP-dependent DNA ligase